MQNDGKRPSACQLYSNASSLLLLAENSVTYSVKSAFAVPTITRCSDSHTVRRRATAGWMGMTRGGKYDKKIRFFFIFSDFFCFLFFSLSLRYVMPEKG